MAYEYDVFISYNNQNRAQVQLIVKALKARGLRCWIYDLEQRPGQRWISALETAIGKCASVAVFIGAEGIGSWQSPEIEVFLQRAMADHHTPVIPVLLPGAPDNPQLTHFLGLFTWVDFRAGVDTQDALWRLVWGITQVKPEVEQFPRLVLPDPANQTAGISLKRGLTISLSVVAVLIALASLLRDYFGIESGPDRPELYALRVQVLDPQKNPLNRATLRVSAGHEPQKLSDGWWQVEIPRAKLPEDGRISLWVEHELWSPAQRDIELNTDPNPSITMQLEARWAKIFGRILDQDGQPLPGLEVSLVDKIQAPVQSDALGRFEFTLVKKAQDKVRVRAQLSTSTAGRVAVEEYCYFDKPCEPVLAQR